MKGQLNKTLQVLNTRVNKVQVMVIMLIFTIFLGSTGLGWSWYKNTVTGNDSAKTYTATTATLNIAFNGGSEFNARNILPGWTGTKTFTVTNSGGGQSKYVINWASLVNTFVNKNDFVYSITSTNGGGTLAETKVPSTGNHMNIMKNITITGSVTQTYTVTFKYINRDVDQSSDIGKFISGKFEILDANEANDTYGISSN